MTTLTEARLRACALWPYGSHAILSLIPVETPRITRLGCDPHFRIYYNPEGLKSLTADQGAALILHELYHLILRHDQRAGWWLSKRDPEALKLWNKACDMAVNSLLRDDEKLSLPGTPIYPEDEKFDKLRSAENYYSRLRFKQWDKSNFSFKSWWDKDDGKSSKKQQGQPQKGDQKGEQQGKGEGQEGEAGDQQGKGQQQSGSKPSSGKSSGGQPQQGNGKPSGNGQPQPGGQGGEQGEPQNGEGENQPPAECNPCEGTGGSCADGVQREWELDPPDPYAQGAEKDGLSQNEIDALLHRVAENLMMADKNIGHERGGKLLDWAKERLGVKIDPRRELLSLIKQATEFTTGVGEYSYRRVNRRSSPNSPLPGNVMPVPRISVLIDTSGSMDTKDLGYAVDLVGKVLNSLPNRDGIKVYSGDTAINTAKKVFNTQQIEMKGGGGTEMDKLIPEVAEDKPTPQLIICATDGMTGWPEEKDCKGVPVVACLTRRNASYDDQIPKWIKKVHIIAKEQQSE